MHKNTPVVHPLPRSDVQKETWPWKCAVLHLKSWMDKHTLFHLCNEESWCHQLLFTPYKELADQICGTSTIEVHRCALGGITRVAQQTDTAVDQADNKRNWRCWLNTRCHEDVMTQWKIRHRKRCIFLFHFCHVAHQWCTQLINTVVRAASVRDGVKLVSSCHGVPCLTLQRLKQRIHCVDESSDKTRRLCSISAKVIFFFLELIN